MYGANTESEKGSLGVVMLDDCRANRAEEGKGTRNSH